MDRVYSIDSINRGMSAPKCVNDENDYLVGCRSAQKYVDGSGNVIWQRYGKFYMKITRVGALVPGARLHVVLPEHPRTLPYVLMLVYDLSRLPCLEAQTRVPRGARPGQLPRTYV